MMMVMMSYMGICLEADHKAFPHIYRKKPYWKFPFPHYDEYYGDNDDEDDENGCGEEEEDKK